MLSDDPAVIASKVAPLPNDSPLTLKTVMKISNKENLTLVAQDSPQYY